MSTRLALAVAVFAASTGRSCERDDESLAPRCAQLDREDIGEREAAEALAAFEQNRQAGNHLAATCNALRLSRAHRSKSRFVDALRWADSARTEALASGDEPILGLALTRLGNLLHMIGDYPRELEVYAEARRHLPESDRGERARLMIYEALVAKQEGNFEAARQFFEDARDLAGQAGDQHLVYSACINLSDIALIAREFDDAERYLGCARTNLRKGSGRGVLLINDALVAHARGDLTRASALIDEAARDAPRDSLWKIECHRGIWAKERGDLAEAERRYRAAIAIVEEMRRTTAPTEVKAPFFEGRWEPFQRLFALELERGDAGRAFAILMQAQGRMFMDALTVSVADSAVGSGDRVQGAIQRVNGLGEAVPLVARSPLTQPVSGDEVLATLRRQKIGHVLAYFVADSRMRLIAVVDGEPRTTSVDIPMKRLRQLVGDFAAGPDDDRLADQLGAALLPDDALPAEPGARLYVIPTTGILRLPFAALRVRGQRLLERNLVVYGPSVAGLAAMASNRSTSDGPPVVIADTQRDLHSAEPELRAVVTLTKATAYKADKAVSSAVRSADRARLLHLISHSGVNESGGYIALADRNVGAADILSWKIRPQLVAIPTCSSAGTVRGEMWGSLASAFLAAGAEHVVATLASVRDPIAAEFTELFYALGGADDPVGGAARAQRKMAQTRSVAEWSPFIVAGK
jgi:tetratricopeptide (TPR) repeat protein